MAIDGNGARLGLADVVRLVREDIRASEDRVSSEVTKSEERVTRQIDDARSAFLAYQSDHLGVHTRRAEDTDKIHRELKDKLETMTLIETRRAGALAVILLIVRTLGQNWQVVFAIVALLGILVGRVDIAIGPEAVP